MKRRKLKSLSSYHRALFLTGWFGVTSFFLGCSSGGSGGSSNSGSGNSNFGCDGSCAPQSLTTADVTQILQQAIAGATSIDTAGTFAVVDRVGNVLALYQMSGAPGTTTINGQIGASGGLEGVTVPATLAAISKAGTGAYLSSQGNAFSTRTASQIVQENFLPGERNKPGGPLFGVQFSQLLCSDVTVLNAEAGSGGGKFSAGGSIGPRPLPLGLSADPGGIPLYKNGDLVGGIGVEFDGLYTVDRVINDHDDDPEERVALTGSLGFEAPSERVADVVFAGGRSLRYTDLSYGDLDALPETLPDLDPAGFKAQAFYTNGTLKAGVPFGSAASGVMRTVRHGSQAAILVNGAGAPRFPSRAGRSLGGSELQANEVEALLDSALLTADRARAAIRNPRDTRARVSIWVVDDHGTPLGFTRSEDAPVFGIDVSLQKARTAAFFSSSDAQSALSGGFGTYAQRYVEFTGGIPLDGSYALTNRAVGNLARPFFVDGINGNPHGPFSLPFPGSAPGVSWSPFNTGLQLDLVTQGIVAPILSSQVPSGCASAVGPRLNNGIQIFPGSVPLYRDGVLIGAIGISGDGIDQDDMTAFFGSSRAGLNYAGHTEIGDAVLGFNAPPEIRSDMIPIVIQDDARLRYVNCPEGPFIGDNDQNVCE